MAMAPRVLMPNRYDISHLDPFVEKFINGDPTIPFFEPSLQNLYGSLWKFKTQVEDWSLAVSRYYIFVWLLHKEKSCPLYLELCVYKQLKIIEEHHRKYIELVVGAVDQNPDYDLTHIHFLIVEVGKKHACSYAKPLIKSMLGTSCKDLWDKVKKILWGNLDGSELSAIPLGCRLILVFLTLTHYITNKFAFKNTPMPLQSSALVFVREDFFHPFRGSIQQREASMIPTLACSHACKRSVTKVQVDPTLKKKCRQFGKARSLGSGLTQTKETKKAKAKDKEVIDYQKVMKIQKTFWYNCTNA